MRSNHGNLWQNYLSFFPRVSDVCSYVTCYLPEASIEALTCTNASNNEKEKDNVVQAISPSILVRLSDVDCRLAVIVNGASLLQFKNYCSKSITGFIGQFHNVGKLFNPHKTDCKFVLYTRSCYVTDRVV